MKKLFLPKFMFMVQLAASPVHAESFPKADGQLTKIKFEIFNNQIYLKLRLNDHNEMLTFIFDSGAGCGVLDSTVATRLYDMKKAKESAVSDVGGTSALKSLENQTVRIGELAITGVPMVVVNLTKLSTGKRVDGIIGYDILAKYVMQIDIDRKVMAIFSNIVDIRADKGHSMKLEFDGFLPKVWCEFTTSAGQIFSGYYLFDSGAAVSAVLNTPFVNTNRLLSTAGKTTETLANGLNSEFKRYRIRIKEFRFGGYRFAHLPVELSQATSGVTSEAGFSGLLGNLLLFRFNLILDYRNQTVYFKPNRNYDHQFEFPNYEFTLRAKDGKILIADVSPGSPEAIQGLIKGSELMSINGKTAISLASTRAILKGQGKAMFKVRTPDGKIQVHRIKLYPRI